MQIASEAGTPEGRVLEEEMAKPQKKRVLFVEQTQDGTIGGSHYCLLYIIQLIDREKYEPIVMFYQRDQLLDEFKKLGAKIIVYEKPRGREFGIKLRKVYPVFVLVKLAQKIFNVVNVNVVPTMKFVRMILKEKVDVIHLNNAVTVGVEWIVAARLTKRKCLTFQRGYHQELSWLRRYFGNRYHGIYCVSEVIRNNLIEKGINPKICFTLYDGIDPEKMRRKIERTPEQVRREFGIENGDPLIGMVGNFVTWKGQDVLVDAVGLLTKEFANIRCLMIGSEVRDRSNQIYFRKVLNKIKEKRLNGNVFITGYRSDVADLLNAIEIQVHPPTLPDPFPHVILEGMTLGKPIIASNIGGAIESLEEGRSGLLTPPNKPDVLAQKISFLFKNADLRKEMGSNARQRVCEKFSIKGNIDSIEAIYGQLFE